MRRRRRLYRATCARRSDLPTLPVGRRVVVIGGGMTAIDVAVQSKLLGAESVTIVYRRGQEQMKASGYERELAQTQRRADPHLGAPGRARGARRRVERRGVRATPARSAKASSRRRLGFPHRGRHGVHRDRPARNAGRARRRGAMRGKDGRIVVDAERRTSLAGVWAGGDCVLRRARI